MKIKKIIFIILIFIIALAVPTFINNVDAASLGYLTIKKERVEGNITYKHQLYANNIRETKNVWKLVTCNADGTPTYKIPDIYCLRAGLGFTSEDLDHTVVNYTKSYEMMNEYNDLVKYFENGISSDITLFNRENEEEFKAVMWILDNMLLEGAKDTEVNAYLKQYAGYTDETLAWSDYKENVLTKSDIEAIQQLAIWYFTNSNEEAYHKDNLPDIYMSVDGDIDYDTEGRYETYPTIYNGYELYGTKRQESAATLYNNLITQAKEAVKNGYVPLRDITIYLAGTNAATEQPVVQVKESTKEVDVALRKFITAVNGKKLDEENSRAPVVDSSKLNKEKQTTAEYNHTKVPVKVSVGDTVTYTLRLYNEGEIDTYIKEVTDYLPPYLEYVPYGKDTGNWWKVDRDTNRIATSLEDCTNIL